MFTLLVFSTTGGMSVDAKKLLSVEKHNRERSEWKTWLLLQMCAFRSQIKDYNKITLRKLREGLVQQLRTKLT